MPTDKIIMNFKDKVVLYPCDDDCPRPEELMGLYPYILEYTYNYHKHLDIRSSSSKKKFDEYCRILSFEYNINNPNSSEKIWVWNGRNSDKKFNFLQKAYSCDSDKRQYFKPYAEVGEYIRSHTNFLLDVNEKLSKNEYENFHRALYWYQTAKSVYSTSFSLSYQCYFHAIESFIDGKSTTAKIKKFIEEHANIFETDDKKFLENIYDRRSEITHGSFLFYSDKKSGCGTFNNMDYKHQEELKRVKELTKNLIFNWAFNQVRSDEGLIQRYRYLLRHYLMMK